MSEIGSSLATAPFVEARINYLDPARDRGVIYDQAEGGPETGAQTMRIYDGRQASEPFSLERNGFRLVRCPVDLDFADRRQVAGRYAPFMRSMIRRLTGASRVLLLGQTVRSEGDTGHSQPAFGAHIDSDVDTVRRAVASMYPDPEPLLAKRFAMINAWRPLAPVERAPLAMCDASTVSRQDLRPGRISFDHQGAASGRVVGYNVVHNPAHRWWYFPRMQPDEVLVFKLADTDPDAVQFTAHSAIDDPNSVPDAPPRRSIDLQTVAFFD